MPGGSRHLTCEERCRILRAEGKRAGNGSAGTTGRVAATRAGAAMTGMLRPFPVHTLDADNGKEFGAGFFFARPYHSWERGLNARPRKASGYPDPRRGPRAGAAAPRGCPGLPGGGAQSARPALHPPGRPATPPGEGTSAARAG